MINHIIIIIIIHNHLLYLFFLSIDLLLIVLLMKCSSVQWRKRFIFTLIQSKVHMQFFSLIGRQFLTVSKQKIQQQF